MACWQIRGAEIAAPKMKAEEERIGIEIDLVVVVIEQGGRRHGN